MTKQELIERIARAPGVSPLTRKAVAGVVDALFNELAGYFAHARVSGVRAPRFTYPGFGTFTKKLRRARGGRDPRTGAPIVIPPTLTISFQPGLELRAVLNPRAPRVRPPSDGG